MDTQEEVLAKVLEYKLNNDLASKLTLVKSEWETVHSVGTITLPTDPIPTLLTSFREIIISAWDEITPEEIKERADRFPVAYVFVSEVTPSAELSGIFEQEDTNENIYACGIRIIDRSASRETLEKKLYRYVHAVWWMMLDDPYLSGSGWRVENVSKAYSGTVPLEPLMKAGQVSFIVTMPEVVE